MKGQPIKIGLTGGIGSGKTTVAQIFEKKYCPVFYTDIWAMKIQNENPIAIEGIKKLFGNDSYKDCRLDRKKIAAIVFSDSDKLQQLNELIHPLVKQSFQEYVDKHSTSPMIICESAILIQSGFYKMMDFNIMVHSDLETRIQRVIKRDHITRQQVIERINNQMPDSETQKYCKYIIENNDISTIPNQIASLFDNGQWIMDNG